MSIDGCPWESGKLLDRVTLKTGEHRGEGFERDRFDETCDVNALVSGGPTVVEGLTIRQRQH